MRARLTITSAALLAACGQSNKEQLHEAANQSDPAAAQVLNGAAENGMNAQDALQEAGNAEAGSNSGNSATLGNTGNSATPGNTGNAQ